MMLKGFSVLLAVAFVVVGGVASYAADDTARFPSCKYCGMDREKFAHSRVLIEYNDGTTEGFCSLHCAAVDLAVNIDRTPKSIMVGDYVSKELVDAEKAFWIVGGNQPGVMSARAKWAFKRQADASAYMKGSGGVPADFETAMKTVYEDMYQDTKAIRDRRAMKKKAMQEKMGMEKKETEHGSK
jgi:copper chaperone NosL